MAEAKKDILEEAVDIAVEQAEVIEKSAGLLKRIIWNHRTHVGVAFVAGAGLGTAVTYKVTKDKLTKAFELRLDEEVESIKEYYGRKNLVGDYATPQDAAKKLLPEGTTATEALKSYQGGEGVVGDAPEVDDPEEVIRDEVRKSKARNIFENGVEDFRWEEEMAKRDAKADTEPYIITFDEFNENEPENEQWQLTYLAGEAELTIIDEQSQPIQNADVVVDEENLVFGYGSKDSNIVYIRNPRLEADMEIVRSEGTYASEVLGIDVEEDTELKHSQKRPRRMRESDE